MEIIITIALGGTLTRLVWVDLTHFRLPDILTIPLVIAGIVMSYPSGSTQIVMSFAGGMVGYALFWLIGEAYHRRTGIDGLGLGDAKLFAASGTWLGLPFLPYVLLISAVSGLIFALLMRKTSQQRLAFGPWLAFGFFSVWIAKTHLDLL